MYCPRCAAQNHDQTKFCRSCGTDLQTVVLALNAHLMPRPEDSNTKEKSLLKQQSGGIRSVVQGLLLFVTSAKFGVALALFSNQPDWIIIWLLFCGWLAVWGAIEMGAGISKLILSRMTQRRIDGLAAAMTVSAAPAAGETQRLPETETAPEVSTLSSVTEHTTTPLMKPHPHP